jgi:hypothetical protein
MPFDCLVGVWFSCFVFVLVAQQYCPSRIRSIIPQSQVSRFSCGTVSTCLLVVIPVETN